MAQVKQARPQTPNPDGLDNLRVRIGKARKVRRVMMDASQLGLHVQNGYEMLHVMQEEAQTEFLNIAETALKNGASIDDAFAHIMRASRIANSL